MKMIKGIPANITLFLWFPNVKSQFALPAVISYLTFCF